MTKVHKGYLVPMLVCIQKFEIDCSRRYQDNNPIWRWKQQHFSDKNGLHKVTNIDYIQMTWCPITGPWDSYIYLLIYLIKILRSCREICQSHGSYGYVRLSQPRQTCGSLDSMEKRRAKWHGLQGPRPRGFLEAWGWDTDPPGNHVKPILKV